MHIKHKHQSLSLSAIDSPACSNFIFSSTVRGLKLSLLKLLSVFPRLLKVLKERIVKPALLIKERNWATSWAASHTEYYVNESIKAVWETWNKCGFRTNINWLKAEVNRNLSIWSVRQCFAQLRQSCVVVPFSIVVSSFTVLVQSQYINNTAFERYQLPKD